MISTLVPGLTQTLSLQLNEDLLAGAFAPHFSTLTDPPPIFATAFLAGFMEWACIEALQSRLEEGESTIGTLVHFGYLAPASLGTKLTAEVKLLDIKDCTLRFRVDCYDECELISSGFHERVVIDKAGFMDKLRGKATRPLAA